MSLCAAVAMSVNLDYIRSQNYYELLGIAPSASRDEIVRAYEHLARLYHPHSEFRQKVLGIPLTPLEIEGFKMMTKAFYILTNSDTKEEYDRYLPENVTETQVIDISGYLQQQREARGRIPTADMPLRKRIESLRAAEKVPGPAVTMEPAASRSRIEEAAHNNRCGQAALAKLVEDKAVHPPLAAISHQLPVAPVDPTAQTLVQPAPQPLVAPEDPPAASPRKQQQDEGIRRTAASKIVVHPPVLVPRTTLTRGGARSTATTVYPMKFVMAPQAAPAAHSKTKTDLDNRRPHQPQRSFSLPRLNGGFGTLGRHSGFQADPEKIELLLKFVAFGLPTLTLIYAGLSLLF